MEHPCFEYISPRSKLLTLLMNHIPSVAYATYKLQKHEHSQLHGRYRILLDPLQLDLYRVAQKSAWVSTEPVDLVGVPGTVSGRIFHQITTQDFKTYTYLCYFRTEEEMSFRSEPKGIWRPLPEPVEGLYLLPSYRGNLKPYHEFNKFQQSKLLEFASIPLLRWCLDNKRIKITSLSCPYYSREDVVDWLDKEYNIRPERETVVNLCRAYIINTEWYRAFRYIIRKYPNLLEDHFQNTWELNDFFRKLICSKIPAPEVYKLYYRDTTTALALKLQTLYTSKHDNMEVLSRFLDIIETTAPDDIGSILERMNLTGTDVGGYTKSARK